MTLRRSAVLVLVLVVTTPLLAEDCIICGKTVEGPGIEHQYRGRDVVLCGASGCSDEWTRNPSEHFAELQPKGALFQESIGPHEAVRPWAFYLGVYFFVGLFFAAASGYVAVNRSQPAARWFMLGLAANVVGFIATLAMAPRGVALFGVPDGLAKVPSTSTPTTCKNCGHENHPTATRCARCEEPA